MNNDAIDKAVKQASKLAAKLKDWRSELATVEAQAVTLADQRIAALTIDETERADKLADAVARANGRAADLQQMIVKRETEVKAALMQAWDSVIVTSAAARYAEAERDYKEKNDRYLSLAPQAANAQTAAGAAQAVLFTLGNAPGEAANIQNRSKWVDQQAALLRGEAVTDLYMPSWLNGQGG